MLALATISCTPSTRYLDEHSLLATPEVELKLRRYWQSVPLSFEGETYVILCRSWRTRGEPAAPDHPAGWTVIDRGAAIGSGSAAELAKRMASRYLVLPGGAVVWSHVTIQFALDGCARKVSWSPTTLPAATIRPTARPDFCSDAPILACRMLDFQDARLPRYSDVRVAASGEIAFWVRSRAFATMQSLQVRSADGGRTWSVIPASEQVTAEVPTRAPLAVAVPVAVRTCTLAAASAWFGINERMDSIAVRELPFAEAALDDALDGFEPETDGAGRMLIARADLDGDGVAEFVIRGASRTCGTGGCPFHVLDGRSRRSAGELLGWRVWAAPQPGSARPLVCTLSHVGAGRTSLATFVMREGTLTQEAVVTLDDDQLQSVLERAMPSGR